MSVEKKVQLKFNFLSAESFETMPAAVVLGAARVGTSCGSQPLICRIRAGCKGMILKFWVNNGEQFCLMLRYANFELSSCSCPCLGTSECSSSSCARMAAIRQGFGNLKVY